MHTDTHTDTHTHTQTHIHTRRHTHARAHTHTHLTVVRDSYCNAVQASDGGNGSECVLNAPTGASGGLKCTTSIEAVVLDINDNTPTITAPVTQVHVLPECFEENTITLV